MAILAIACCGSRKRKCIFTMAEGILPYPEPSAFLRWPIFPSLTQRSYVPDAAEQFEAFVTAHKVQTIIVTDRLLLTWRTLLGAFDAQPIKVNDVWLFKVAKQPARDVETTWRDLRRRFDTGRFVTLVAGAEKYLSEGGSLDSLSVLEGRRTESNTQGLLGRAADAGDSRPADRIEAKNRSALARWSLAR